MTRPLRREPPAPYSLTMDGAVAYTGLSRTRLEALLKGGKISAIRVGRRTMVVAETLRGFLDQQASAR